MRSLIVVAAAVMAISTAAQAETIHVAPNAVFHWQAPVPFKTIVVGGASDDGKNDLIAANPGATNRDLIVSTKEAKDTVIGRANVLMLDANGNEVANLKVVVTPTGGPLGGVHIIRGGRPDTHLLCDDRHCQSAIKEKEPIAVTTTRSPDGSMSIRREY
jgi:hypothetical protein